MYVNVRSVDVGRVGVCMLCECDNEEREHGVGVGVNDVLLFGARSGSVYSKTTTSKNYY